MELWFEALEALLEVRYSGCGTRDGDNDYDRLELQLKIRWLVDVLECRYLFQGLCPFSFPSSEEE